MLDSLVRVSRRVNENHFVSIAKTQIANPQQYNNISTTLLCSLRRSIIAGLGANPVNRVLCQILNPVPRSL
jgi:hypothetical protein